jgi:hypothetical protein
MQAFDASDVDRGAIRRTLEQISAAWQERRYDELEECFDERVVFAAPGFQARLEGRNACIASYREFMERATITEYRQGDPFVEAWHNTGIGTYSWTMAWDSGGSSHRESGHDVFVFDRVPGTNGWRAVWRTILVDPHASSA